MASDARPIDWMLSVHTEHAEAWEAWKLASARWEKVAAGRMKVRPKTADMFWDDAVSAELDICSLQRRLGVQGRDLIAKEKLDSLIAEAARRAACWLLLVCARAGFPASLGLRVVQYLLPYVPDGGT
mmetsp:Transcript_17482/g.40745  ORF Transcript_17482/g.40745 Transcript_17482/m.40745 type:complete len:127 (+) Transcript_17482:113-493(+)